ncbi:anti-sigma regulatory factor (Ser/Thr protein kinase) [Streptomyces sp. LBL]|uniref:ATP-binding protein n=1 Tax=Streptomyces sp. LBL TaxID=2940562 RepID=UPI0024739B3C|nr:ATP-binding protein [Streptomyces sp. LBL]MDH6626392.1 anti-sigma regulatory factor (Ser/Thr protein kinase) [Streptomyces sp. LBL]
MFTQRFSSTPLGARLARHLALYRMHRWGYPYGSAVSDTVALIVAELTANAVTHGRVPGRDFELQLTLRGGEEASYAGLGPGPRTDIDDEPASQLAPILRIDVSDTRGECRPPRPGEVAVPDALAVEGRGLLLVDTLADRWEVLDRVPVGKTVRAELNLPH